MAIIIFVIYFYLCNILFCNIFVPPLVGRDKYYLVLAKYTKYPCLYKVGLHEWRWLRVTAALIDSHLLKQRRSDSLVIQFKRGDYTSLWATYRVDSGWTSLIGLSITLDCPQRSGSFRDLLHLNTQAQSSRREEPLVCIQVWRCCVCGLKCFGRQNCYLAPWQMFTLDHSSSRGMQLVTIVSKTIIL